MMRLFVVAMGKTENYKLLGLTPFLPNTSTTSNTGLATIPETKKIEPA
jgi:hypothetical protein